MAALVSLFDIRNLEFKSSYTIYDIDFMLIFGDNKIFKKELVFHCLKFNGIFDYDNIGTVRS